MTTYQIAAFLAVEDEAPTLRADAVNWQPDPLTILRIAGIDIHFAGNATQQGDRVEALAVELSRKLIQLRVLALDEADRRAAATADAGPIEPDDDGIPF